MADENISDPVTVDTTEDDNVIPKIITVDGVEIIVSEDVIIEEDDLQKAPTYQPKYYVDESSTEETVVEKPVKEVIAEEEEEVEELIDDDERTRVDPLIAYQFALEETLGDITYTEDSAMKLFSNPAVKSLPIYDINKLVLSRTSGESANDIFTIKASSILSFKENTDHSGQVYYNETLCATVTVNETGTTIITFGSGQTDVVKNLVLQNIAYRNTEDEAGNFSINIVVHTSIGRVSNDVQVIYTNIIEKTASEASDEAEAISLGTDTTVDAGAGDDVIKVDNMDFASIDGGTGDDTLALDTNFTDGQDIVLDAMVTKVKNIETIDLREEGANALTISEASVKAVTDGDNILTINGDADDSVVFRSEENWTQGTSIIKEDGIKYDVYALNGATVHINADMDAGVDTTRVASANAALDSTLNDITYTEDSMMTLFANPQSSFTNIEDINKLVLSRHSGESANDIFTIKESSTLTFKEETNHSGELLYNETLCATVTVNETGTTTITFVSGQTDEVKNFVLQNIAYRNTEDEAEIFSIDVNVDTQFGTVSKTLEVTYAKSEAISLGTDTTVDAGAGDDVIKVDNMDFASIDGGTGDDTLALDTNFTDGQDIVLDAMVTKVKNIETIDLREEGANALTISEASVKAVTDSDNILTINGDADDSVVFKYEENWMQGTSIIKEDGIIYDVYTLNGATVHINADMGVATSTHTGIELNGTDQYLTSDLLQTDLDVNTGTTFATWVKFDADSGRYSAIFGSENGGLFVGKETGDEDNLWISHNSSGQTLGAYDISSSNLYNGQWHHIAYVQDGNNIKIIIDGVELINETTRNTPSNPDIADATNITIGDSWESDRWDGSISDVQIYDKPLTTDEVRNILGGDTIEGVLVHYNDKSSYDAVATGNPTTTSTPIILDLDGDGIETLNKSNGVAFDIDADGDKDTTGWVGADDGLLVFDKNNDGIINDASELFGEEMIKEDGSKAEDGYDALRDMDTNADGIINAEDDYFDQIQVWKDANSDGITDDGELIGLTEAGVFEINLNAIETNEASNGNTIGLKSTYTDLDGKSQEIGDVWFEYDENKDQDLVFVKDDGDEIIFSDTDNVATQDECGYQYTSSNNEIFVYDDLNIVEL